MSLPFRLSRRSLLKAAARLGVGAGLALLGLGGGEQGRAQEDAEDGPYFRESASKLTLGNQYYEVDFDSRNGAITRIFDKRGGGVVSEGNADGSLWSLGRGGWSNTWTYDWPDTWLQSKSVSVSGFSWDWSAEDRKITFDYNLNNGGSRVNIRCAVQADAGPFFDLSIEIRNITGPRIDWIDFPSSLLFQPDGVKRAMLPFGGGVMLDNTVFAERRSDIPRPYPSWMAMADLVWLDTSQGSVAIYALHDTSELWQAVLGIGHRQYTGGERTYWRHAFAIALEEGDVADLPTMRIRLGESPISVLSAWRKDNAVDRYPSLRAKLGDLYEVTLRSPTLPAFHSWYPIRDLEEIDSPVILHPFGFQEGVTWSHTPDWWPPSEEHGGQTGYLELYGSAQRDGKLVMPYTWPYVVTPDSPTAKALQAEGLSLDHIAAQTADGDSLRVHGPHETYWDWFTNASPASGWYLERLGIATIQHDIAESNLVYWDQVGSPGWWYDQHPETESPLRFSQNWLRLVEQYRSYNLTGEGFFDRLGKHAIAGYYSMLLGDEFGMMDWAGTGWSHFPAASAMFRDASLQIGHNLLGITQFIGGSLGEHRANVRRWTGTEILRYRLAQGLLLTQAVPGPTHEQARPWIPVATAFSHYVLGRYADELVTDVQGSQDRATTIVFETFTVHANWMDQSLAVGEHTLVPSGVASQAHDGSVTGGVFQRYNGRDLSPGEHYLIEQRKPQGIIIRQPMGADTPITVQTLGSFGTNVEVTAFDRHHIPLRRTTARASRGELTFRYDGVAAHAAERRDFEASIELGPANRDNGLQEAEAPQGDSIVVQREGRTGRRPQFNEEGWGSLAFAFDRQIVPPEGGDVTLTVEFFDESEGNYLGVVYDNVEGTEKQSWQGPMVGNGVWRTFSYPLPDAAFWGRQRHQHEVDFALWIPRGVSIGKITVTNTDELERRTVAYYTIHDPAQGETLTQGLHLRGWTDATQPIADLDLDGLGAIYAWDAEEERWRMYSPHVPAAANNLDRLEQGRAYYVRVANGQTLHWPEAPYGSTGFHLQSGRNLVCWLGTPDKTLTDAIAPLRGMKAEPLVSVQIDGQTYDVEESRQATEPLAYGQALWVEIDAVGPTRWLQF